MPNPTDLSEEYYDASVSLDYVPERVLLAAILDRAVRDLTNTVSIVDTRDAVAWFTGKSKAMHPGFKYIDIVQALKLSYFQVEIIRKKVDQAKNYLEMYIQDNSCPDTRPTSTVSKNRVNKSMPKRKESRESCSALVA